MTTWSTSDKMEDAPLPWSDLRQRLDVATLAWLLEAVGEQWDQKNEPIEDLDEQEDETGAHNLFASRNAQDIGNDDNDEYYPRVHQWSSSVTEPGGVLLLTTGSTAQDRSSSTTAVVTTTTTSDKNRGNMVVQVQYILSDAPGGHGDTLWPAARHIANLLADPVQCRRLLWRRMVQQHPPDPQQHHPLQGMRFLELGAGAGLPSWTALHCGAAHVVCTDQPIAARLCALAEAAERNVRQMQTTTQRLLPQQVTVSSYLWGTDVEDLLRALPPSTGVSSTSIPAPSSSTKREEDDPGDTDSRRFDVVVAADCIYMPDCHDILLQSIQQLLRPQRQGVALLPFALHGNVPDPHVWSFIETARNVGFHVERLESQQLTTSHTTLDAKRALIYTLRLTLP